MSRARLGPRLTGPIALDHLTNTSASMFVAISLSMTSTSATRASGSRRSAPSSCPRAPDQYASSRAPYPTCDVHSVEEREWKVVSHAQPRIKSSRTSGTTEGDKGPADRPSATHLVEEPGALDQVSQLVKDWFQEHLR